MLENSLHTPSAIQHILVNAEKNHLIGGTSFSNDVKQEVFKLQRTRWILRKFILHSIYRKLNTCTDTDIVTLEPIRDPVHVVDWKNRQKYSFEVMTLHKDITQTLLHRSGLFPNALFPKNPLTNIPLSLGQLISVWNTFSYSRLTVSSVVSIYRSMGFNHAKFSEHYHIPLLVSSMKKCLLNHLDTEYTDYILRFIEEAYENNNIRLSIHTRTGIERVLDSYTDNEILRKFRIKCVEYNYTLLIKKNTPNLLHEIKRIYRSCLPIIRELQIKGNLH